MQESFSEFRIRRGETAEGKAFEFASIAFRNLPFIEEFYFYESIDSTNERAKSGKIFSIFFAEEQKKGRGRLDREWISKKGGLYFSINLPLYSLTKLTLISALSVAEAFENARLKWPNDVLLFGKKFCGVLGETIGEKAIIGIGINVENDVREVSFACNLSSFYPVSREEAFERVTRNFAINYIDLLAGKWEELFARYVELCETVGRKVRVITPTGEIEGIAELGKDGAIVVDGKKIYSGDCVHIRTI
ncbi:MAG: biotin--[acetyl-CoA-carboxylase] ligase [Archaeoglobaceae archaeon]|nr:biotin--[acetyl-CoA-carboxylase] ligase [Archaeoglobaceae archaeon]MDW7989309.1 biotin--[acetyl-CoA-carboxylase] ligase [Archaeoglobaceae archaeon]